jgi:low affinity Fe/Cu permease
VVAVYVLAIYVAGIAVLVWAPFSTVPTFSAVRADFVINTAVLCHVSVALAFIPSTNWYVVPDLTYLDIYFNL